MSEQQPPAPQCEGLELRGANFELFCSSAPRIIVSGGADTGKTWAGCLKAHVICSLVPGAQGLFARKNFNALSGTVVMTYKRIVDSNLHVRTSSKGGSVALQKLTPGSQIRFYGGETPTRFIYPNGSQIWLGGMDNPESCLSAERDFIFTVQTEQFSLDDWEKLSTRCTGRGAIISTPQLYGDCNPGSNKHWIRVMAAAGKLRLLVATHKDNPTIYRQDGTLTEEGVRRMAVLQDLTGVRRKRLFEGVWATAEGAVYENFDEQVHVKLRAPKEMVLWYLAMDEGFTHPAVTLLIGSDSDRRWHIFREFYKRGVVPEDVVSLSAEWYREMQCSVAAVDEAAAGLIASLQAAGVNAVGGKGRILDGIAVVTNRLKVQKDGRPRLTIDPSCVNTINEFQSYVWKPEKDVPVDAENHCFTAGTMILTRTGLKAIETIKAGEFVWSPVGWSGVWQSSCSGMRMVKNYGAFTCTPDHKIFTQRGLVSIDSLRYLDILVVWKQQKKWSLMACLLGAILNPSDQVTGIILNALVVKLREAAHYRCTVQYGNSITGRFLTEWKCTIKTLTLQIIAWIILKLLHLRSTDQSTIGEGAETRCLPLSDSRPSGTRNSPQLLKGTRTMSLLAKSRGRISHILRRLVKFAARNTKLPSLTEANSVVSIAGCADCGSAGTQPSSLTNRTDTATLALTYNLNTSNGCYFANGVLVSNSLDSIRYLAAVLDEGTGAFDSYSTTYVPPSGGRLFIPRHFEPRTIRW